MKVLSLFDGIAGCRQALKELNVDCEYYASEIDIYAIQVAMANHPDIKQIGDVKEVNEHNNIDLLIGGSPCQDLSIAKKDREGLEGKRSGLFYEYLRILNETKPKYFILENVASMSNASKDIITKELFNIEPIMINSALVTAQQRKRLYWVGKLVDGKYRQVKIEQPEDKKIYLKDIAPGYKAACMVARRVNPITSKREDYNLSLKKVQYLEVSNSNKSRCLSTVQKDCLLSTRDIGRYKDYTKEDYRPLTITECERLQGFPDGYCDMISKTQAYKALGNSFTVPVIKHLLKSM